MVDVYGECDDSAEAHHHAGLAVAAAGDGEGWVRERDEMPGPKGSSLQLGILFPTLIFHNCTLALLFSSFLPKKILLFF